MSDPTQPAPDTSKPAPSVSAAQVTAEDGSRPYDVAYPDVFKALMRQGWLDTPLAVVREPGADHYARHRAALAAAIPGEFLVIPSGRDRVRSNDTFFPFRAGSDFVWLTGEQEPGTVLILDPDGGATLYVRPHTNRDTDEFYRNAAFGELWVGRRRSLAERSEELGIRTADLATLPETLARLAPAGTRVQRGFDPAVDAAVGRYDRGQPGARDRELAQTLAELRLPKDPWEIAQLQEAVDATVRGFEDVARVLPADRGVSERLIEGVFGLRARHDGNGVGYSSIVGAGAHATTLHWIRNDGVTVPGELLLIDMGVEARSLYTADVTRTIPVSGRFSPLQREIYQIAYAAQEAGMATLIPGIRFEDVALACNRVLAEGLDDLKLLPVSVDEALDKENMSYRRWSLHGFGHMVGLDVHDCAQARQEKYRDGTIEENYVITVEPGLYFQPDDDMVPEELRGIGIRIEDDVLVTASGAHNLSAGLPRAPEEVEAWLDAQRAAGPRLPG
jgi:Xaa-Pro aminopeptidase